MRREFSILVFAILVLMPFASILGSGVDRISVNFELDSSDEYELDRNGSVKLNSSGIEIEIIKSSFSFSFSASENDGNNVDVLIILSSRIIKPSMVGSIISKSGRVANWEVCEDRTKISFYLGSYSMDSFRVSKLDLFAGRIENSYRHGKRYIVFGEKSAIFDRRVNSTSGDISIFLPKNLTAYEIGSGEITHRDIMVKYKTTSGFLFPLREKYKDDNWYEVRDINATTYQLVVHFLGKSGDLVIVIKPGILDYLSLAPILDLLGMDEPSASIEG